MLVPFLWSLYPKHGIVVFTLFTSSSSSSSFFFFFFKCLKYCYFLAQFTVSFVIRSVLRL